MATIQRWTVSGVFCPGAFASLILAPFSVFRKHRRSVYSATELNLAWCWFFCFYPMVGFGPVCFGSVPMALSGLSFVGFKNNSPSKAAALSGMGQLHWLLPCGCRAYDWCAL